MTTVAIRNARAERLPSRGQDTRHEKPNSASVDLFGREDER